MKDSEEEKSMEISALTEIQEFDEYFLVEIIEQYIYLGLD